MQKQDYGEPGREVKWGFPEPPRLSFKWYKPRPRPAEVARVPKCVPARKLATAGSHVAQVRMKAEQSWTEKGATAKPECLCQPMTSEPDRDFFF